MEVRFQGRRGRLPANVLIPLERQLNALQHCADSFYIMKLCSRLFVLYCRSRPTDDKSRHFDPHFEEVRGGVEPWCMARWKARVEFLLSVIELLFTACRNARIASAVLATAIPSVRLSVCLSVTRRYCVKTTARSTVQFAPLDSKMCLVL